MSGLGFKTFTAGDVLTAADVNGYLMSQAVMVFADAAARNTALPSPTEGMTVYEKDINAYAVYDGAAWIYQGYWETYSPTFAGITIGDGTSAFEYARVGDVVFVRGQIKFGSTTAITATTPQTITFTLPLTTDGAGSVPSPAVSVSLGAAIDDSTGARVPTGIAVATTTTAAFVWFENSGSNVVTENNFTTTTRPFVFAVDDLLYANLVYEAA